VNRKIAIALAGVSALLLSGGAAFAGLNVIEVPEPASLSLMAAGIGTIAAVRYLRGRK